MPRYFFTLADHVREEDREGIELAGPEQARAEAIMFAGHHVAENPGLLGPGQHFKIETRDETQTLLFTVVMGVEDRG